LRHLAPAVFLILLLILLLASFTSGSAPVLLTAVIGAYFLAGFYFSLKSKAKISGVAMALPFASFCFHVAYGAGTLFGLRYLFQQPPITPIRPGLPIQE
jgi:hypothetical protein